MRVILLLIVAFSVFFFINNIQKSQRITSTSVAPITALATVPKEVEVKNLDGSKKLILQEDKNTDNMTYTVFIADGAGANRQLLYTKTVGGGTAISLPPNSWSPDSKLVFVKETHDPTFTFLVFKVSREPFADGKVFIDVAPIFTEKQPSLRLNDITGWDGDGLLHVTSYTEQGTKGPSFWFDVASKSFLQLF